MLNRRCRCGKGRLWACLSELRRDRRGAVPTGYGRTLLSVHGSLAPIRPPHLVGLWCRGRCLLILDRGGQSRTARSVSPCRGPRASTRAFSMPVHSPSNPRKADGDL